MNVRKKVSIWFSSALIFSVGSLRKLATSIVDLQLLVSRNGSSNLFFHQFLAKFLRILIFKDQECPGIQARYLLQVLNWKCNNFCLEKRLVVRAPSSNNRFRSQFHLRITPKNFTSADKEMVTFFSTGKNELLHFPLTLWVHREESPLKNPKPIFHHKQKPTENIPWRLPKIEWE